MSKIFEALQNAEFDLTQTEYADEPMIASMDIPSTEVELTMEQEMIDLYRHIEPLLPDSTKMTLQFIGSRPGEGVSTIVREYAAMATTRLGKSVLILDANQNDGDGQRAYRIKGNCGWDEGVRNPDAMDKAICCIGGSKLYVSCLSRHAGSSPLLFDAVQLSNLFTNLKTRFDLVLIDSPPMTNGTDSTALSRFVDGVVLVVEAEKTRWPVVENTKAKIISNGGNILGVVFNKRRYYIPEFIYRRL
jgi:protein-tyrosine kinase